jgi:type II secretion system protein H
MNGRPRETVELRGHNRAAGAFTLVEVLVTLVILGIAAAIVVPVLSNTNDLALSAAARHVVADLEYAKNLAVTKQREVSFRLCHSHQHYYIYERNEADTAWEWIDHPVEKAKYHIYYGHREPEEYPLSYQYKYDTWGRPAYFIEGVEMGPAQGGSSYEYVSFDPYGSPGSVGEAVRMRAGGETMYVFVAPITGNIYVRRLDTLTADDIDLLNALGIPSS